jgi:hypothetical protein
MLKRIFGLAGLVGVAWGVASGIFVGHLLSLIPGCPPAVYGIIGTILGIPFFIWGTAAFSFILTSGLVELVTGTISRKGFLVATVVTLISIAFTYALVGWVGLVGWKAAYILAVWNFVVFSLAASLASGLKLAVTGAASFLNGKSGPF